MTILAGLSDASEPVAAASLGLMAIIYGLLPARWVLKSWIGKRSECALIWAVASLHRAAVAGRAFELASVIHLASSIIVALVALTAARGVLDAVRGERP